MRYALRRCAAGLATLAVLSVLVFVATSVLPGDAASALLGRNATKEALSALHHDMGLDRPLLVQYADWMGGLLHGDLGRSVTGYVSGEPVGVWEQISGKLANSLTLAVVSFALIVLASVVLGGYVGLKAGRWQDHLLSTLTLVPSALPEFVLGALLLGVFFTWLDVLPPVSLIEPGAAPWDEPALLVLPVLTVLGVTVGAAARMIRAGMLDALKAEFVAAARLNGIPEARVVRRYALRNALGPGIQVLALIAQYLVGGLLVVEAMFGYPGIGKELVDAVIIHDNTEVRSITMVLACAYVGLAILADLLVMLVVPKLRTTS
ncbi:ABC transporter permease [Nonomuraea sediminis]|uniref:ABC transporter permease n=1 Tax=Nonomuraea sediminis TaxID=2835864 RepID=UPI001BDCA092|nr:ABC transporter permease [Nonomuraea sediminis]